MDGKWKRNYSKLQQKKQGISQKVVPEVSPKQSPFIPKEVKCVFSACDFCSPPPSFVLHYMCTVPNDGRLICIKRNALIKRFRVCL